VLATSLLMSAIYDFLFQTKQNIFSRFARPHVDFSATSGKN